MTSSMSRWLIPMTWRGESCSSRYPNGSAAVSGRVAAYALFGLALEKGVDLRARLRGCWIRSRIPSKRPPRFIESFSVEPPLRWGPLKKSSAPGPDPFGWTAREA